MPTRFDRDTAVRAVDPSVAGPGVHEGRIDRGWWVVRGPNGGYVEEDGEVWSHEGVLLVQSLQLAVVG